MVMEGDLSVGDEHTIQHIQHTDDVSQNYTPET